MNEGCVRWISAGGLRDSLASDVSSGFWRSIRKVGLFCCKTRSEPVERVRLAARQMSWEERGGQAKTSAA